MRKTIKSKKSFAFKKRRVPLLTPIQYYWSKMYKNKSGFNFGAVFLIIENGWMQLSMDEKHFLNIQKSLLQKILNDEKYIYNCYRNTKIFGNKWLKWCRLNLNSDSLKNNSNIELFNKISKYIDFYEDFARINAAPSICAADRLYKYFKDSMLKKYSMLEDDINLIISPTKPSYLSLFNVEFLKISLQLKNKLEKCKSISLKKDIFLEVDSQIKNLVQKYFWIPFDYTGPDIWIEAFIFKELKKELKNPKEEIECKLNELLQYSNKLRRQHSLIKKKYRIDQGSLGLIKSMHYLSSLQDERKAIVTESHFYLNRLMIQISKRTNISVSRLYLLSRKEFGDVLIDKLNFDDELNRRENICIACTYPEFYTVFSGEKALKVIRDNNLKLPSEVDSDDFDGRIIRGQIASPGIVRGRAKIILSYKEISKIKKGDILVSTMTTPDFVSAMEKASAIITNEGGITCHAAIVSRELNIPCIIGTKIATQVLKDGDLIEVDANNGIIKILNEK